MDNIMRKLPFIRWGEYMYGSCRGIKRYKPNWGYEKYLKEHSQRDYLLFVIGINTGLKITELLSMKFEDVLNEDGLLKSFMLFLWKMKNLNKIFI